MTHPPGTGGIRRIHQLIDPWVVQTPQVEALRDPQLSLGYGELDAAVKAGAAQLQAHGVGQGDRLLIVGENCVAIGVLVLACSRIDAWSCVVNGRLSPREVDGIIEHCAPRRVIYTSHVSPDAAQHAQRHGAKALLWDRIGSLDVGPRNDAALPEPRSEAANEQVAALIYTSGTSGAPKGVMLTHANIAFAAGAARRLRGFAAGDLLYGVLPMAHVVGLSIQLMGALASGAGVLLEPRFSPALVAKALAAGVTSFVGVPAMYARLLEWLQQEGASLSAPSLRMIGAAGSPLTPPLKDKVEALFGLPLLNGYGLTECSPTVAQARSEAPRADCAVGPPIPEVQVRIVRRGDSAAEGVADAAGELHVRGPNVMKGYYRNEALTREVIDADGWFNTGDMARQGPDGALHIVGRSRELIIRSGFNVYPLEVEQVINGYPGIVQSAVVGRTVDHNEEVVAFVEVAGGKALDQERLRGFLRERLSAYKLPSEIRVVTRLPSAPTGKILKSELKAMAQEPADSPDNT